MLKSDKGFTIIELLLLFFIMVLFAKLGLSAHQSMSRIRLSMTATQIQTLTRAAQNRAYGEQNTHIVAFYSAHQEFNHIQNTKVINKVTMPRGITMKQTNFPDNKLYFTGKLGPSRGGTIELNSKSHTIEITVLTVTGRVNIYPLTRR